MTGYTTAQALGDLDQRLMLLSQSIDDLVHAQHTANLIAMATALNADGTAMFPAQRDALLIEIPKRLGMSS